MLKVFVLDDDESVLNLLEKLLTKEGYEVKTMSSSRGATREIRNFRPNVVVLDIIIPDQLTGDSVVDMIRSTVIPCPKIFFYSSKPATELFKLTEEKNVDGYVCKTDGPKALINKINSALS